MPLPAYLTVEGKTQRRISSGALGKASAGNAWQAGHEDQILVQSFNHSLFATQGMSAGRRKHTPLIITKALDSASPRLNTALCSAESLKACRLDCYRVTADGAGKELFYTVELSNAVVVGIERVMPDYLAPSTAHLTYLERVHFAYQMISWRHEIATTQGEDHWQVGH